MFILYPLQSEHIEALQYSFIKLKQNPVFVLGITVKALPVIFYYAVCRGLFFSASELAPDERMPSSQALSSHSGKVGTRMDCWRRREAGLEDELGCNWVSGLFGTQLCSCRLVFSIARAGLLEFPSRWEMHR